MINKVVLIGNLGRDPDIRFSSKGEAIANLALATSESWKDKDTGEKVEKVEWHRVVVFGRLADVCQKYLHKGSKIYVEGKLQTRKWDKNGVDQYTTEVVLSGWNCTLMMLDSKVQPVEPKEEEERPKIQPVAEEEFEDDIPF